MVMKMRKEKNMAGFLTFMERYYRPRFKTSQKKKDYLRVKKWVMEYVTVTDTNLILILKLKFEKL